MSCKNCKYNHQTAAQCMRVGMCRANVELLESKLAKAVKTLEWMKPRLGQMQFTHHSGTCALVGKGVINELKSITTDTLSQIKNK